MRLSSFSQPTDALEMACHFLRPLQTFASREIETHLLAFEVFVRRDKILLMLQSIKRAHDLDPHHPVLHFQKSLFIRKCTYAGFHCELSMSNDPIFLGGERGKYRIVESTKR